METRRRALLEQFVDLGVRPTDTEHDRAYKSTHILIVGVTALVVPLWSVVYGVLGLWLAAAIPLIYIAVSVLGLAIVARTRRIRLFRGSQMTMWLTLPFLLQWSVGGFVNGSAVGIWAISAPLLASIVGAVPRPWFVGFVGLSVFSGLIDSSLAAGAPEVPPGVITSLFALNFLGIAFVMFVSLRFFIRERERARIDLEHERQRSEQLLLNILPEEIAGRLKGGATVIADRYDAVTILFADLVGSTPLSDRLTPEQLVEVLNGVFTPFDDLADELGLEKIKTLGDAYMVVGGLPVARADHVEAVAEMALAMRRELEGHSVESFGPLQMRFGMHTGPVVAGVIGKRKFTYDLWGDTVNTAARMEAHGLPGEVQVTEAVYQRLRDRYRLDRRGPVEIKGKGVMETYLLRARLDQPGPHAVSAAPLGPSGHSSRDTGGRRDD
ncbi:MAG: adenylate/guanylate cyclase domain-containing protein [Actinomycetota bacterium]|nr:adenylate/guanylate cyclase domain-containing protein [Actinomycetota bacterium]